MLYLFSLVGCLVTAALFGMGGTAAAAAPRLEIAQPTHDLGAVFEDQPLEAVFLLRNTGDAPLYIKDIKLDCACSAVDYNRMLPPGGRGRIVFRVNPFSALHRFCKTGIIVSNDPRHPEMLIQVCGDAKPFIEIQPSHVIRLSGRPQDHVAARIRLISHQKTPLTIKGFETDLGGKVLVKIREEKPGRIFDVEVINQMKQTGAYKGKIEILTSSDQRPRLMLRVFGDLHPAAASSG